MSTRAPAACWSGTRRRVDRLATAWRTSRDAAKIPAWAEPKAARRRLINTILQLGIDAIFCFRAKEKLKIRTGQKPLPLGFMPIAGEEFVYDMTVNCLLYPSSGGVPTWTTDQPGERIVTKLPNQFSALFKEPRPLSEDIGREMAQWAAGGEAKAKPAPEPVSDPVGVDIDAPLGFGEREAHSWRQVAQDEPEYLEQVIQKGEKSRSETGRVAAAHARAALEAVGFPGS